MLFISKMITVILLSVFVFGFAQEIYEIEPVVVTATRYPKDIMEITRTVTIIDSIEITRHASLVELLDVIAGVDMKVRGDNIQTDPSIRGSTFQQVLVMIDGVRVNDPQTGHHNLNIPVPLSEIERIEILHGTASSLYGSDACGGVINIITKRSGQIKGQLGIGSFSYRNFNVGIGNKIFSIDFENKSSGGYEPGYEYQTYNLFNKINIPIGSKVRNDLSIGYLNKSFGAKNFYAPYPSWESNQAFFTSLNSQFIITRYFMLNPILSFRTHIDTFVLDRDNPEFYANRHQSFTYGAQLINHLDLKKSGYIIFGAEGFVDSLNSTRLGQHSLQRMALFLQIERKHFDERLILIVGLRDDYYRKIKNSINPHISFAYKILPSLKFSGSMGSSFRAPSFTELYYQDPANRGDSLLKSENGWEYELGLDFQHRHTTAQIAGYYRLTDNDIDWVKKSNESVWHVMNIGGTKFYGIEPSLKLTSLPWIKIKAALSYIHIIKELPAEYISKYALQIPKITTHLNTTIFSTFDFDLKWSFYDKDDNRFLLNTTLNREFTIFRQIKLACRFSITNLLDNIYEDFQGVSLPGRELKIMLNFSVL